MQTSASLERSKSMRRQNTRPASDTDRQIAGWQLARHLTLGTIVLAGSLVLGLQSVRELAQQDTQQRRHHNARVHTYSGIGVELERIDGQEFVRRVFPNSPAQGKIFPGARLESVNGVRPGCSRGWAAMIRGPVGSKVELAVSYDGRRHEVDIERDLIRIAY